MSLSAFQRRRRELAAKQATEEVAKAKDNVDEELEQLRERAKELVISRAAQMGKEKLLKAIEEKETELKLAQLIEEAKGLGIEVTESTDITTLIEAIEARKAQNGFSVATTGE